ncbi:hypothetical protein ACNKHQ_23785 [Shigella flexneri]
MKEFNQRLALSSVVCEPMWCSKTRPSLSNAYDSAYKTMEPPRSAGIIAFAPSRMLKPRRR